MIQMTTREARRWFAGFGIVVTLALILGGIALMRTGDTTDKAAAAAKDARGAVRAVARVNCRFDSTLRRIITAPSPTRRVVLAALGFTEAQIDAFENEIARGRRANLKILGNRPPSCPAFGGGQAAADIGKPPASQEGQGPEATSSGGGAPSGRPAVVPSAGAPPASPPRPAQPRPGLGGFPGGSSPPTAPASPATPAPALTPAPGPGAAPEAPPAPPPPPAPLIELPLCLRIPPLLALGACR